MKTKIITLILVLTSSIAIADIKYTKVADNNVEVVKTKEVESIDGEKVKVWDTANTISYGKERVDKLSGVIKSIFAVRAVRNSGECTITNSGNS